MKVKIYLNNGKKCFKGDITIQEYNDLCRLQDKLDESNEKLTNNEIVLLLKEISNNKIF